MDDQQFQALVNLIGGIRTDLDLLREEVGILRKDMDALGTSLHSEMDAGFTAVRGEVNDLREQVAELHEQTMSEIAEIKQTQTNHESIYLAADSVIKNYSDLEVENKSGIQIYQRLEGRVSQHDEDIKLLKEKLSVA